MTSHGTLDPMVSVVVVNYGRGDLTERCIRSVYASTDMPLEVIVVDNASADPLSRELPLNLPRARFIWNDVNRGFAPAVNQGLLAARADILVVLNNDTKMKPGALDACVAALRDDPASGAVGCELVNPDGTLQPSGEPFPSVARTILSEVTNYRWDARKFRWPGRPKGRTYPVPVLPAACLALRRAALEQVGLLDENFFFYYEDADLCRRLRDAGWVVLFLPHARVEHAWGATSGRHSPELLARTRAGQLYYFGKHGGRAKLLVLRMVLLVLDVVLVAKAALALALHLGDPSTQAYRMRAHLTLARTTLTYRRPRPCVPRFPGASLIT